LRAVLNSLAVLGVIVVTAAGDQSTSRASYPTALAGAQFRSAANELFAAPIVSVAAIDEDGALAEFSNYGPWVTGSAPGVDLVSTLANASVGGSLQPAASLWQPPSPDLTAQWIRDDVHDPYIVDPASRVSNPPPEFSATGREPRYADAVLTDSGSGRSVGPLSIVLPASVLELDVTIGALSARSLQINPTPFPADRLPEVDIELEVLVTSETCRISGRDTTQDDSGQSTRSSLLLPANGDPAVGIGVDALRFVVQMPQAPTPASIRISYYYRDAVVQSQRIDLSVGTSACGLSVRTDFTSSQDFRSLQAIPDIPRLSFVVNQSDDSHTVVIRQPDGSVVNGTEPRVLSLAREPLLDGERRLRDVLTRNAPTTFQISKAALIDDLRRLAPLGSRLYQPFVEQAQPLVAKLAEGGDPIIHVARTAACDLTLPWSLLYDITITSRGLNDPGLLSVCPLVATWDERNALFAGTPNACPYEARHEENMLCPFGFWGFRYQIEVLSSAQAPITRIPVGPGSNAAIAVTTVGVTKSRLERHVRDIREALTEKLPGIQVQEASTVAEVRRLLSEDLPLVYFFCHGKKTDDGTWLAVGADEYLAPADIVGWVNTASQRDKRSPYWRSPTPLLFINACQVLQVGPKAFIGYLNAFLGAAGGAGVIATEVKVEQNLAMRFATSFFRRLISFDEPIPIGVAMRQTRAEFLRRGNLFGLVYTPYCWASLSLQSTSTQTHGQGMPSAY
jgi:hypothetical protein